MAAENASGVASGKLPQAQALVPRGRQSVSTVGGDHLYNKKKASQPIDPPRNTAILHRFIFFFFFQVGSRDVHSRRRCGSGPQDCAWGNRRPGRHG